MPTFAELPYDTCLTLLREHEVGRVALCTADRPHIVPVNYSVVDDDMVVFRTTPYSALGTHANGGRLALEIDRVDIENRSGWSVVASGTGSFVSDSAELRRIHVFRDPDPWAGGQRWLFVGLRWTELTGRVVGSRGAAMVG
jgi:nitroimidazol reductase NimA-like FMN-containing flavoprotein (pyridoxamine 5'-phosphate oxidase superfamily)